MGAIRVIGLELLGMLDESCQVEEAIVLRLLIRDINLGIDINFIQGGFEVCFKHPARSSVVGSGCSYYLNFHFMSFIVIGYVFKDYQDEVQMSKDVWSGTIPVPGHTWHYFIISLTVLLVRIGTATARKTTRHPSANRWSPRVSASINPTSEVKATTKIAKIAIAPFGYVVVLL